MFKEIIVGVLVKVLAFIIIITIFILLVNYGLTKLGNVEEIEFMKKLIN